MLVRDPVTGQVYDDGQPVQSIAPYPQPNFAPGQSLPGEAAIDPAAHLTPNPNGGSGDEVVGELDMQRATAMAAPAEAPLPTGPQMASPADIAAARAAGVQIDPSLIPPATAPVAQPMPPGVVPTQTVPPAPRRAGGAGGGGPGTAPAAPNPYQKQIDQDTAAARDVAKAEGASAKSKAQAGADQTKSLADQIQENAHARDVFDQERVQFVQQRQTRLEAETDRLAAQPFTSLWSRMDKGTQIGVALSMALGTAASALQSVGTGQVVENPAVKQLHKLVDDDLQLQRDNFARSKEVLALRRSNLESAKELYALKSDQLAAKQVAALEALKAQGEARLKALGIPDVEIAQNKALQELDQKAHELKFNVAREIVSDADKHAEARAKVALDYANAAEARAKAAAPKGAQPNGEMLKARDFANRAIEQERTLAQLPPLSEAAARKIREDMAADQFYEKNPAAKLAAMKLGQYKSLNEKLSPDEQRYVTAVQEFNNAILRKESGAAISLSEWDSAANRYSIRPGDSAEVKAQKIANRRTAIQGLGIEGGQQPQVQGALDQLPPPTARWVLPSTGQYAGKHVLVDDQGHIYGVR